MKKYKLIRTPFDNLIVGKLYITSLKTGFFESIQQDELIFRSQYNPDDIWAIPISNHWDRCLVHYKEPFKFGK